MARQLIYGNEIIGFTPSSGIITAKGYVPLPKLLSIVNSTLNVPIYSFADPDTTAVVNYDPTLHQTTFHLSTNTVGMGSTDSLQIYYEKEDIEIAPSKFLIDPASKLRVSQAQSLIDTDFEYGVQSTKWETVKLVNNIPTAYSSGIPDEAFEALSINVTKDNDFVSVDCPEPHNLVIGSVIDIQGLKDPKYEGVYVVRDITDANTFAYKIPFKSPKTTQLETEFTLIYPGAFYTGSSIDILDIQTTSGTASTLTVTTDNIPGIINNCKLFLKKSRATKRYAIQSPADVIDAETIYYQTTINHSGTGVAITAPPGNNYLTRIPIIEDIWIGDHEFNFDTSDINGDRFRLRKDVQVGIAKSLDLMPDDVIIFYTPKGNQYPRAGNRVGLCSYHPYRVRDVYFTGFTTSVDGTYEEAEVTISDDFIDSTPRIVSVSAGTTTFGNHRFIKANGGRIVQNDRRGTITFSQPHNLKYGDRVTFFSKWDQYSYYSYYNYWWYWYYYGVSGISTARGNWESNLYREYRVSTVLNSTQVRIPEAAYYVYYWWGWYWWWGWWYRGWYWWWYGWWGWWWWGWYWWWWYGYNWTFYVNDDRLVSLAKIKTHPLTQSIHVTQDPGFSTTNYKTAQTVRYTQGNQGYYGTPSGLSANTDYLIREIKSDAGSNWYQFFNFRDAYLNSPLKLTIRDPEKTFRNDGGYHKINSSLLSEDAYTIRIPDPIRGSFTNNQRVRYATETTSVIGGLTQSQSYYAKTEDSLISPDRFRLANEQATADVQSWSFSGTNRTTASITVITGAAHTCGIIPQSYIQISGYEGRATENLLLQGIHQVTGVSTSYSYYYYYTRRYRRRWRGRYYWTYYTVYELRRRNPLTTVTVSIPSTKNRLNVYYQNITTPVKACGIVSFSNRGGIGTHFLVIDTDGAADDTYTVKNTVDGSFELETTVEIPPVVNGLSGGDTTRVGIGSNWLKIVDHRLADGTKINYSSGGYQEITPLVNGEDYYVRVLDGDHIGLSTSQTLALNRFNDVSNTDLIRYTSLGSTTTHTLTSNSVKGFITGIGSIGVSTESYYVTGRDTKFYSDFANGDIFRIWRGKAVGPGDYFESRIVQIKSNTSIKLEEEPTFTADNVNYFIPTRFYAVSDAKVIHRPFDGAVQMSSGLVPNTQLIRQTRKYFRYQAGKGIQCAMAINFNPTFDIDEIKIDTTRGDVGVSTDIIIKTKFPHGISTFAPFDDYQRFQILNVDYPKTINGEYFPVEIIDDFRVRIQTQTPLPNSNIEGFPQFNVTGWRDALLKCGMFDDQNGFFFQFDGFFLNVVRRSNTQQLAGSFSVTRGSHLVRASGGKLTTQIAETNRIIIRGQTYKVTKILDDDLMYVQPAYRSKSLNNVVASKVIDTILRNDEWNIDRMDGTGVSGYRIDTNKIQMVVMDYSWYGAGTIRFGMKTQMGDIKYCHEFIHNNQFTEAYFRSGNLPVRYEVETLDDPYFGPSLYHWGVSVLMDGGFDQDKVYHFSADSRVLPFTNGGIGNYNGVLPTGRTGAGSTVITNINRTEGQILAVGEEITSPTANTFQPETRVTAIEIDTTSNLTRYTDTYRVFIDKPAITTRSSNTPLYVYSGTAETLKEFIPLITIRLSPSVDNSVTGNIGYREIINRMQLILKSANVLTSHDCEVNLIVNPKLSVDDYEEVGSPSLSQMYRHSVGDTYSGGQVVYSFRAQGGGAFEGVALKRGLNGTTVDLSDVAVLGNAVLGGDSVYPDGPDILTLAVRPIDTSLIRGSSPFIVSGRLTWVESQA